MNEQFTFSSKRELVAYPRWCHPPYFGREVETYIRTTSREDLPNAQFEKVMSHLTFDEVVECGGLLRYDSTLEKLAYAKPITTLKMGASNKIHCDDELIRSGSTSK